MLNILYAEYWGNISKTGCQVQGWIEALFSIFVYTRLSLTSCLGLMGLDAPWTDFWHHTENRWRKRDTDKTEKLRDGYSKRKPGVVILADVEAFVTTEANFHLRPHFHTWTTTYSHTHTHKNTQIHQLSSAPVAGRTRMVLVFRPELVLNWEPFIHY